MSDDHARAAQKGKANPASPPRALPWVVLAVLGLLGWGGWQLSTPSDEVKGYLGEAVNQSENLAQRVSADFGNRIRSRKGRVEDFVDEATGFFRSVGSLFDDDREKRDNLAKLFAEEVLSDDDVRQMANLTMTEYKSGLTEVQNNLAVNLEGVLSDEVVVALQNRFQSAFDESFYKFANEASNSVVLREGGGFVIEVVVIERIVSALLARLGTSTVIAGAGVANSYWSFGLSFVAAIGVNYIWDWLDESDDRLVAETRRMLDEQANAATAEMEKALFAIGGEATDDWNDEIRLMTLKDNLGLDP